MNIKEFKTAMDGLPCELDKIYGSGWRDAIRIYNNPEIEFLSTEIINGDESGETISQLNKKRRELHGLLRTKL